MIPFTLITDDKITIHGIANSPKEALNGMLCFHMMPATKESYNELLDAASEKNILAWAIDFRGHGESTNSGSLDFRKFTDEQHRAYKTDAQTAYKAMKNKVTPSIVIGASIGANIALQLQVEYSIPKSILLSPGVDYRGVKTLPSAAKLTSDESCLIISSLETYQSGELAKEEAETIFNAIPSSKKKIIIDPSREHGTNIIKNDASLLDEIIKFITI